MKKILTVILGLFFIQGCQGQSLPKKMPDGLMTISLFSGGGMSPEYKKIRIKDGVLEFEEVKRGNQREPQKWSAKVSDEDLTKLYKVFYENRFDKIKNEKPKYFVSDAGSEEISIYLEEIRTFTAHSGKNHPLSEQHLERFHLVKKAIFDLVEKYKPEPNDNAIIGSEAEKYIQGKWRVAGKQDKHAWYLEWTFDNGNFTQRGYPPLYQEGKYRVLSITENKIMLELYNQKGTFGTEKKKIEIIIDRQTNQLKIWQMDGFSRVSGK